MLKKENRLPLKNKLISKAAISTEHFIIKIAENNTKSIRSAVIIGKKIDKRAVYRNKMRRQVYELLKDLMIKTRPGTDILFIMKKSILEKTKQALFLEIKNIFIKERLLK